MSLHRGHLDKLVRLCKGLTTKQLRDLIKKIKPFIDDNVKYLTNYEEHKNTWQEISGGDPYPLDSNRYGGGYIKNIVIFAAFIVFIYYIIALDAQRAENLKNEETIRRDAKRKELSDRAYAEYRRTLDIEMRRMREEEEEKERADILDKLHADNISRKKKAEETRVEKEKSRQSIKKAFEEKQKAPTLRAKEIAKQLDSYMVSDLSNIVADYAYEFKGEFVKSISCDFGIIYKKIFELSLGRLAVFFWHSPIMTIIDSNYETYRKINIAQINPVNVVEMPDNKMLIETNLGITDVNLDNGNIIFTANTFRRQSKLYKMSDGRLVEYYRDKVSIRNPMDENYVREFKHPYGNVDLCVEMSDGRLILSSNVGGLLIWNPADDSVVLLPYDDNLHVTKIESHSDGCIAAVLYPPNYTEFENNEIHVWYNGMHKIKKLDYIHHLLFLPDGKLAFCDESDIYIWDLNEEEPYIFHRDKKGRPINSLVLLKDGNLASTSFIDMNVHIWEVATGVEILTIQESRILWACSLSKDSRNKHLHLNVLSNGLLAVELSTGHIVLYR